MRIELGNMEDDYEHLKDTIVSLYTEPFELYIETKHISNVSIYMVVDFAFFLNKLKKRDPQYLKYTTMWVYSEFIYNILYKLFTYLSRPIAPVKVIYMEEDNIKYIKTFFP
jgi:hypothetical protein